MKVAITDFGKGKVGFAFVGHTDDMLDWLALIESKAGEVKPVYVSGNRKPAVVPPTTGMDSENVSPKDCSCKGESVNDSTLALSQQAIDELKNLVTDSGRGNIIRRLIKGDIITSDEYSHICSLMENIGRILGKGSTGRKPVARRGSDGRVRVLKGYYLKKLPTIQ